MQKTFTQKIIDLLFSYKVMISMLILLATGAAVATFIENDYGTSTARVFVYNHWWYETVMIISVINMLGIIYRRKMWKSKAKFIFHTSFAVMLIGAGLTRYVGFEGIMQIQEGQTQNRMISLEPYFQVHIYYKGQRYDRYFQKEFAAIGDNSFNYSVPFASKTLNLSMASYKFAKKGKSTMNLIGTHVSVDGETKTVKLVGNRGTPGVTRDLLFKDDVKVSVTYGSRDMVLPFAIKLRDFQLDRYPGSMSPSSYASEVTLIDKEKNVNFDYRIFMNNTLKYGNYQFFQSSYDPSETGTILSVNNDPGKWPTYLGYLLLTIGLIMNMFDKKSRFVKLTNYIKQFNTFILAAIIASFSYSPLDAKQNQTVPQQKQLNDADYLDKFRNESLETSKLFARIVVQSNGRMKPMDTLNTDILNKLARKSTLLGMDSNQVVLGMLTRPDIWQNVKMLKLKTPKLKKELGLESSRTHIAFSEVFNDKGYKLAPLVEIANKIPPKKRGTYEKDILQLDERLNIAYMIFYGDIFKVFPARLGVVKNETIKNRWYAPGEAIEKFEPKSSQAILAIMKGFITSISEFNWKEASKYINFITTYQTTVGGDIVPSKSLIDNEILFNKFGLFPKLTIAYVSIGFILFIVAFLTVFNQKWQSNKINTIFFSILATLFILQTFGMGMRWYISGHAPWSNAYESLIYIGWSAMFAGLVFFRKSILALSATVVMAGVFMFTAHLNGIDPQITNLVPVLKSYWLTIHVSIITGSYGFLAIGAMLGFMSLLLFIFRDPNKPYIDNTIKHITSINEASLIIGLAMLTVGNFLGGVWANESWGRYWGWDPKETWAWVSIVIYAIVLHLRMINKLNTPYIFSVASTLAFSSVLMTYFGVNFYLSGMHSYATGDPVPIPMWVYVLTALVFSIIAISSRKRDLTKIKL